MGGEWAGGNWKQKFKKKNWLWQKNKCFYLNPHYFKVIVLMPQMYARPSVGFCVLQGFFYDRLQVKLEETQSVLFLEASY